MKSALEDTPFTSEVEEALVSLSEKPALTIYGERNDPFGFQERFREYFDNVDEMVVPKGNHFPMCDAPDDVAARMKAWISTI